MRDRKLLHRAVGVMDAEYLLPDAGTIGPHLNDRDPARGLGELQQTVIQRLIDILEPKHRLHFVEARVVAARPTAIALALIVESNRTRQRLLRAVAVSGCDHLVRVDQCDGAGGESADSLLAVDGNYHARATRHPRA